MMKIKNEQIIIGPDGKTTHVIKSFNSKTSPDKFYMTFIEHISPLFRINSPLERKVLDVLCCKAEFNTGKVILSSSDREEICNSLSISLQTFNNTILKLKKAKLISGERGVYDINPNIFWKGTTDQREKLLKEGGLELHIKFKVNDSDEGEQSRE